MTPSDPGTPPGALSARLLDACEDLPAWWLAPLRAGRGAAEALGRAPVGFAEWDGAWNGFRKPFQAVSAHVEALRNPAPMLSDSLARSVTTAESAVREQAGKALAVETRLPGAIGVSRGGADASSSSPGVPRSGASTRSPSGSNSAKPASAPSSPASVPSFSGRTLPRASVAVAGASLHRVSTIDADMRPWVARAQKAISRWAPSVSMARISDPSAANVLAPQAARADSPEAQAWFGAWVKGATATGPAQATSAPGTASPEAESRPVGATIATGDIGAFAPALASKRSVDAAAAGTGTVSPSPRIPGWMDILDELMPRANAGAQASRSTMAGPAQALDSIPTGSPSPQDWPGVPSGMPNWVTSKIRPGEDTSRAGASHPAETPTPKGAPSVEWLDEEEDLAGKLHRLLRRQAKRRGVDLS